jgi:hypothetical protein
VSALLHAEAANNEVVRLSATVQQLLDALERGAVITEADLKMLRTDCGVLRYAVARTYHSISSEQRYRRLMEVCHG